MALRAQLAALFKARPLAHWVSLFENVDCCVTPVLRLDEALVHPLGAENLSNRRQPVL
jgi:crotonobetainyl-CoA:carnitine CoA-transferase CaiB-like acyl-CoA transferase